MSEPTIARTHTGRRAGSLRWRLLGLTLLGLTLALTLSGLLLSSLFRDHVLRQFERSLVQQLDQLTARLDVDSAGMPVIPASSLSDPRWLRPYSGLYWQLDEMSADGRGRSGVLRSRSLWDASLSLRVDALDDGAVHVHQASGPQGQALMLIERTVRPADDPGLRWRLIVAADLHETEEAVRRFSGVLALSMLALLALLALAAWAQVSVGLKPLQALQRSLQDVRHARMSRLQGAFPAEVQPLVDDFNSVLDRNAEVVSRARAQAGNLAHALKTPLSVLEQAARTSPPECADLAGLVQEQSGVARRHIDWHLARARMAATQRLPGQQTAAAPVIAGLMRVLERVHASRGLTLRTALGPEPLVFAGEEQDLQEMLGNVLDNACKWAHTKVDVRADVVSPDADACWLDIHVDDDGPGIEPAQRDAVMARGVRLDESTPGSGLGLAIVKDLVDLYGGALRLQPGPDGGLRVSLRLPAVAGPSVQMRR